MTFKTRAAQNAFERGLYMGLQGYKLFQAANREAAAMAPADKPARKPRVRKRLPRLRLLLPRRLGDDCGRVPAGVDTGTGGLWRRDRRAAGSDCGRGRATRRGEPSRAHKPPALRRRLRSACRTASLGALRGRVCRRATVTSLPLLCDHLLGRIASAR